MESLSKKSFVGHFIQWFFPTKEEYLAVDLESRMHLDMELIKATTTSKRWSVLATFLELSTTKFKLRNCNADRLIQVF